MDKGASKFTEHDAADHDYPPITPNGPGKFQATNVTMDYFALFLSRIVDRPVVDKSGLPAHYDFKVEFVPERAPNGEAPPDGPSIFEALKLQLGLRLEASKVPSQNMVIDKIEKPAAN
jgi:uncharacterized protein (TIGR03435 family)